MFFQPLRRRRKFSWGNSPHCVVPAVQMLEERRMMATVDLDTLTIDANTGEKPQSKVWQYAGQWWAVLPDNDGTWVWRLDDTTWEQTLQISDNSGTEADVRPYQDLAHALLFDGVDSQYVTLQYSPSENAYELWSGHAEVIDVELSSGVETATIERDSTGRLWIASDAKSDVEVRYADAPYDSWSEPIELADNITNDDISSIAAFPDGRIGVLWSNQDTERFGFRYRNDGAPPNSWSELEIPAEDSALNIGGGMADDHLNVAIGSDGTLYAAVKTSYDKSGETKLGLLVRRPQGSWDPLYRVDTGGTRPIVVIDEREQRLLVAYTTSEGGGDIVYRQSPLQSISFASETVLIPGNHNNVTSSKLVTQGDIVMLAANSSKVAGARIVSDDPPPPVANVIRRQLFYNDSAYDGFDPAASADDDLAIATDKQPLLPGETSSFENYSTYLRGINGLMIDVADLASPQTLRAEDFQFRVGSSAQTNTWITAPAPASITVREGAGEAGSDRITIVWEDDAISNTWLEVRMLATARTGLAATDQFYWGSLPGDTGNISSLGEVNGIDLLRLKQAVAAGETASVASRHDLNRDGMIDETDLSAVVSAATTLLTVLCPLTPGIGLLSESEAESLPSEGEDASGAIYEAIALEWLQHREVRSKSGLLKETMPASDLALIAWDELFTITDRH